MRVQFTIANLLRSTAFFAFGWWILIWMWGVLHGSGSYPHMFGWGLFLAPAAIGGAIGALFGKTPHGVFAGLAFVVACEFAGIIWIVIVG